MNLQTLSGFALARMLQDCAQGSAVQKQIQAELRSREQHLIFTDNKTPWLFKDEELGRKPKKKNADVKRANGTG